MLFNTFEWIIQRISKLQIFYLEYDGSKFQTYFIIIIIIAI